VRGWGQFGDQEEGECPMLEATTVSTTTSEDVTVDISVCLCVCACVCVIVNCKV
jgi:hypothetical protein